MKMQSSKTADLLKITTVNPANIGPSKKFLTNNDLLLTSFIASRPQRNTTFCNSHAVTNVTLIRSKVRAFLWRHYQQVVIEFYVRGFGNSHVFLCPGIMKG